MKPPSAARMTSRVRLPSIAARRARRAPSVGEVDGGSPEAKPIRPGRIIALGDLLLDIVVTRTAELAPGSDVPGRIFFRAGGSAANTCRTVARLGAPTAFVGAVGDDQWGRQLARSLRADGVQLRVVRRAAPTGRLMALIDPDGERTFVTQRGAADQLAPGDLRREWFRGAAVLHLPAYSLLSEPLAAAALRAVELARSQGTLISVDLASRGPLLTHGPRAARERIAHVGPDVLFANRVEAAALTGRRPETLLDLAPIALVKDGAAGNRIFARSPTRRGGAIVLSVATRPLAVRDTTGAGDAFDAGFLVAWVAARPRRSVAATAGGADLAALRRAAVRGNRAAAEFLVTPRRELVL